MNDETMQNKILVIGNGFDLFFFYKTSYNDFINFIREKQYTQYGESKDYLEFDNNCYKSAFIKHFLEVDLDEWEGVENEIKRIICSIRKVFNYTSNLIYADTLSPDSLTVKSITQFDRLVLHEFDFLQANERINLRFYDIIRGIKWKELSQYLENELNLLKKILYDYLKIYVPLINRKSAQLRKREYYNMVGGDPDWIITFNYTDYYKYLFETTNIIYAHGNLNDNNIILGYEDDDENEREYNIFKKSYQKIQNDIKVINRSNDVFNQEEPFLSGVDDNIVYKENIVHIIGLSFDLNDKESIIEIFESDNNKKIIIYHYGEEDKNNKISNLISIFSRVKFEKEFNEEKIEFKDISNLPEN